MLDIEIYKKKDKYLGLKMSGHAESGPYGQDIACAGASVLAISLLNYLLDIKEDLIYTMDSGDDALIQIDLDDNDLFESTKAQNGFRYLDLGLISIAQSYKDNIRLTYQEV